MGRSSGERVGDSICRDRNLAAPSVMADGHVTEAFEALQRWYLDLVSAIGPGETREVVGH